MNLILFILNSFVVNFKILLLFVRKIIMVITMLVIIMIIIIIIIIILMRIKIITKIVMIIIIINASYELLITDFFLAGRWRYWSLILLSP